MMAQDTDGPTVYLAYNRQRNSILANAPPEQMKIIEQTIAYLDVPFGGDVGRSRRHRLGPATMSGRRRSIRSPRSTQKIS